MTNRATEQKRAIARQSEASVEEIARRGQRRKAPTDVTDSLRDGDSDLQIDFTPVPRLRRRRNGWTEARQRGFISALAECGSVSRAARAVGMSSRSAYRLLDAEGADDFARAWDVAIEQGIDRVRIDALYRAMNGFRAEIYRRGKLVRVEKRYNDRLAIALLNGEHKHIDDYRRTAVSRRTYRQELAARDREQAEFEENYRRELADMLERAKSLRQPRVRML